MNHEIRFVGVFGADITKLTSCFFNVLDSKFHLSSIARNSWEYHYTALSRSTLNSLHLEQTIGFQQDPAGHLLVSIQVNVRCSPSIHYAGLTSIYSSPGPRCRFMRVLCGSSRVRSPSSLKPVASIEADSNHSNTLMQLKLRHI